MSNRVELSTFPSSKVTALTMLYLEKQDITDLTPEELVDKYNEVYERIRTSFSKDNSPSMRSL